MPNQPDPPHVSPSLSPRPSALSHYRILDLTRHGPGPYCAMLLGDLGADVTVVDEATPPETRGRRTAAEETAPDAQRDFATMTGFVRRNARRIALNLKHPDGQQVIQRLIARADVLVEGFRPGVAARLGLDPNELLARHPRLIYCSISGYGQQEPYRNHPGHDINYLALGGLLGTTGPAGGPPSLPGTLIADFAAGGLSTAVAILAALIQRDRTGQGQYVDVSLQEGIAALMAPMLALAAARQRDAQPEPIGPGDTLLTGAAPFYAVYETADCRHVSVGALEPWLYAALCTALELPEWIGRQYDRPAWPAMRAAFAAAFRAHALAHWVARLSDTDACFAPVATLNEVLADTQLAARETFAHLAGDPAQLVVRALPLMSTADQLARFAPADPGANAEAILAHLGYSPAEVAQLRASGGVG